MTPRQIQRARKSLGMTQVELGLKMGVTAQTIWRWEHGTRGISKMGVKVLRGLLEGRT